MRKDLIEARYTFLIIKQSDNYLLFEILTPFILENSVVDPFHFDLDPDPRIRFRWLRIRIRILAESWQKIKVSKFLSFFLERKILRISFVYEKTP